LAIGGNKAPLVQEERTTKRDFGSSSPHLASHFNHAKMSLPRSVIKRQTTTQGGRPTRRCRSKPLQDAPVSSQHSREPPRDIEIESLTEEDIAQIAVEHGLGVEGSLYRCPPCGQGFKTNASLNRHVRRERKKLCNDRSVDHLQLHCYVELLGYVNSPNSSPYQAAFARSSRRVKLLLGRAGVGDIKSRVGDDYYRHNVIFADSVLLQAPSPPPRDPSPLASSHFPGCPIITRTSTPTTPARTVSPPSPSINSPPPTSSNPPHTALSAAIAMAEGLPSHSPAFHSALALLHRIVESGGAKESPSNSLYRTTQPATSTSSLPAMAQCFARELNELAHPERTGRSSASKGKKAPTLLQPRTTPREALALNGDDGRQNLEWSWKEVLGSWIAQSFGGRPDKINLLSLSLSPACLEVLNVQTAVGWRGIVDPSLGLFHAQSVSQLHLDSLLVHGTARSHRYPSHR